MKLTPSLNSDLIPFHTAETTLFNPFITPLKIPATPLNTLETMLLIAFRTVDTTFWIAFQAPDQSPCIAAVIA